MRRARPVAVATVATSACLALAACTPDLGGGSEEPDGDLPAAVEAADALAADGLEAIGAAVPGARWAGPSSTLDRCGGDFDIASYSIDGTLLADDTAARSVARAWEDAGLEVDGSEAPSVSRGGATMTYTAGPADSGLGRFEVRVDCTRADGDVVDDLEESAPKDLGADLGLPQDDAAR